MSTIGFIGTGNMASAIIAAIAKAPTLKVDILVYDLDYKKAEAMKKYGAKPYDDVALMTSSSDYLLLAVKPQNIEEALTSIKNSVKKDTVVISIAAGITAEYISDVLGFEAKIVRAMPNTPLMLSAGATALCKNEFVSDEEFLFATEIFSCAGVARSIDSDKMNEIIPINGSSPAFIYEFAKYFIEYGKSVGLDEKVCLELFSQTLIGSARMMTESGSSIDELIAMVTSKGGTTIAGLEKMREAGFEKVIMSGCESCVKRAYELAKK